MNEKKGKLLLFFDTEFTDFVDMDLISIGIVSPESHEFYAENADYNKAWCNEFVLAEVIPRLEGGQASMTLKLLKITIQNWISKLLIEYSSVMFIYDYSGDWQLLKEFLVEYPKILNIEAIQVNLEEDIKDYFKADHSSQHHALLDAKALLNNYKVKLLE